MARKAWWRTRRGIGALIALAAVGLESSGAVPPGTVQASVTNGVELFGMLTAAWGAVQAEAPIGLK